MIHVNIVDYARKIARTAGCQYNPEVDTCIARTTDEHELLGGVIYTDFTGESVAMHVAGYSPHWINRDMLWVCFHYPFEQLGVKRIFGQVPETSEDVLKFDLQLGFKPVVKIDGVFSDGGVHVLKMERDDCKWLKLKPKTLTSRQET